MLVETSLLLNSIKIPLLMLSTILQALASFLQRCLHLILANLMALPLKPRDHAKALIEKLNDDQVGALLIILESMAWPTERITSGEAKEIEQGLPKLRQAKA